MQLENAMLNDRDEEASSKPGDGSAFDDPKLVPKTIPNKPVPAVATSI